MKKLLRQGFTLIELLTVIAIIGILAVALLPAIAGAIKTAKVAAASGGMSKIATSYISMTSGERPRTISKNNVQEAAVHVAQYGDLNNPEPWLIKTDPRVEEQFNSTNKFPALVAEKPTSAGGDWKVTSEFAAYKISIAVANKVPSGAPETTPIMWTRGLKSDGTWDKDNSVFGETHGIVLFKDGKVKTYKGDELAEGDGALTNYSSKKPTKSIQEALPAASTVLEDK